MPDALKAMGSKSSSSGPWMHCLQQLLHRSGEVELCIATFTSDFPSTTITDGGIKYILINKPKTIFSFRERENVPALLDLLSRESPDVIHVHGTELEYGLICSNAKWTAKTVISLQGLIGPYAQWSHGRLSCWEQFCATGILNALRGKGVLWSNQSFRSRGKREEKIVASCSNFSGRTDWDKAFVEMLNPSANYTWIGESLRPEFRESCWNVHSADPYSLVFTNVSGPVKGTETLLDAVSHLKSKFPEIKLRLAGRINSKNPYSSTLLKKIKTLGLEANIEILGYLNAGEMSAALLASRAFVSCSYADNSPNSIGEAQLVGMPVLSTYVGGIPSMIEHNRTGMLFPVGNIELLVKHISEIFKSDALCIALGENARAEALARHDDGKILASMLRLYRSIAETSKY